MPLVWVPQQENFSSALEIAVVAVESIFKEKAHGGSSDIQL